MLRRTDPDRASGLLRRRRATPRAAGPGAPRRPANLRAAFPEKDAAWISETLRGAWEILAGSPAKYVHLGTLWDYDIAHPNTGRIVTDDAPLFVAMRDDGKPALCFAAHLGNWELPAVMAAAHDMPSAVLYRMPNNKAVAREISRIRAPLMGRLIRSRAQAPLEMAAALERGEHLGMLVDQRFSRGVDVTFFGRHCKANPSIARLARQFDCPVVGIRVIRLPDHRFRIAAEGPFELPRDAAGRVDVQQLDTADHIRDRTLGAGEPGPVAVVSPSLAIALTGLSSHGGTARHICGTLRAQPIRQRRFLQRRSSNAFPGTFIHRSGWLGWRTRARSDLRSGDATGRSARRQPGDRRASRQRHRHRHVAAPGHPCQQHRRRTTRAR